MHNRILKKISTHLISGKSFSSAIHATIDDIEKLQSTKRYYFASYDLYEEMLNFLDIVPLRFSDDVSNMVSRCKIGMFNCQQLTSTVSTNQALTFLDELENSLTTHTDSTDTRFTASVIRNGISASRLKYADNLIRANADYDHAVVLKKCIDPNSVAPASEVGYLNKLLKLPSNCIEKIDVINKAIESLVQAVAFYQTNNKLTQYNTALNLLASLAEIFADYIYDATDSVNSNHHKINFLNLAITHYETAISSWKSLDMPPPIDLYLSTLLSRSNIITFDREQAPAQHALIRSYIENNFTQALLDSIPPMLRDSKLIEINLYKELAGMNKGTKRTYNNISADEDQPTYPLAKKQRLAKKTSSQLLLFKSADKSSDTSTSITDSSNPVSSPTITS